ncbi:MAG: BamA/TamA family outer membrane protein, partial [bacterium]
LTGTGTFLCSKNFFLKVMILILLATLSGCAIPTVPPPFGINKVITKQLRWQVAQTPHFEIYYYPQSEKLIPRISQLLEEAHQKVAHDLDYTPPDKTPFFIYATHNDFEQTNISDITGGEGIGGFSDPLQDRLVMPLTGSDKELEYVIKHEYTHIITFGIFYGGFWKSVRLLKSFFYPYWFMEGLAEYETGVWENYSDMLLRDMAISDELIPLGDLENFAHLEGHQVVPAYKESARFIRYLADTYGKDKVALLPLEFKERFDSTSVLYRVTKKDLLTVNKDFQDYLKKKYNQQVEGKKEADFYGRQLTKGQKYNTNPVFSPDGQQLAFITDRDNYEDILLVNSDGSDIRSLLKRKIMRRFDVLRREGHALSWSPDGQTIILAAEKNQQDYLYIINVKSGKVKKLDNDLDSVFSPCFSPDGNEIVFVGMKDGINNIYTMNIDGSNVQQLNDDYFDDNYPTFSPDGGKILYISERNKQLDIFVLDIHTRQITRLTDTPYDELSPTWYSDGQKILFVSDADGIYNIYSMNSDGSGTVKLTDIKVGILSPSFSADETNMVFVSYRFGEMNIYVAPKDRLTPVTPVTLAPPETDKLTYQTEPSEPIVISTGPVALPAIATQGLTPATTGQSPLNNVYPLSKGVPYHFKGATDLFYPLLFYSTADGLYTALYWQGSEILGNHQMAVYTEYYSNEDWLNFQTYYTFKKLRPQFTVGTQIRKDTYYDENNDFIKSNRWVKQFFMSYPFDRFNRAVLGLHSQDLTRKNRDKNDLLTKDRENAVSLSLVRDFTTGEMFDLTRGRRTNFTVYQARKILGGTVDCIDYLVDTQLYANLTKNHILAWRFLGSFSEGPDTDSFNLGGSDAVRGIPRDDYITNKLMVLNTEYRFMIFPKIGYHMWYMIPDFYFKSLQGVLFIDTGLGYNTRGELKNKDISSLKTGAGVGLRLNTFLLETFAFVFRLDYAKRMDAKDNGVVYFTLGPSF